MEAIIFLWMCVEIYSLLAMCMKLTYNENLIFFSSRYANFFSARIWNFLKKWQLINEKAEKMQF